MSGKFMFVHDIVEENGKTIKQNNMEKAHNIPVGTLVEVKYDDWHGEGACKKIHARLWVWSHDRDCDGTPLYYLSPHHPEHPVSGSVTIDGYEAGPEVSAKILNEVVGGFAEKSLTPIEVTQEIRDGYGALTWDEE
jgi:hypothetical protein